MVLGIEPRIVESKSTVLPLHYTTTWSFLLESNQRLIVFTTKLIPQMVERTGI
nr:MAG TPA: hypothetical protein [Caudoviricetes sp.]